MDFDSLRAGIAADPLPLALIAAAALALILVLLWRRAAGRAAALDLTLRDAAARAERAELSVAERSAECGRLSADIGGLRARIEADQATHRDLAAQVAALDARVQAGLAGLSERDALIARLTGDLALQRERVDDERQAQQALRSRIAALETQGKADREAAEEKIALLSRIRDDMQERFRQLADEALRSQGEAFGRSQAERLEATLTPLREHVGHFQRELSEVHKETVKDRERLKAEIAMLTRRSEQISQDAVQLTRALKGDRQKQGAWGEMILESILERSGLRPGEEYETQARRIGIEGERLRPDVVVHIPGGKSLVIDSKVSLNDYAMAVNGEDEATVMLARKRHVTALRNHITGLSGKSYQLAEGLSVDYVIMFVPIEGALSEALREDGALTEYALERHVTIATPTTLMMALRTVSHVWAVERRNRNAEAMAKRAGLIYDKVAGFVGNMEKVGKGIDGARRAWDDAMGQLARGRGNLLSQVETLRALGAPVKAPLGLDFDGGADLPALTEEEAEP